MTEKMKLNEKVGSAFMIAGFGLLSYCVLALGGYDPFSTYGIISIVMMIYTATLAILVIKWGNLPDWISLQGPFILLRTSKTGVFDRFAKYKRFWRWYGNAGIILVAIMGLIMIWALLTAFNTVVVTQPEPTGIYAPENIILIPGVNEFVPSTFAVWFAIIFAVLIHEFGHGIMSRVENIAVKYTGIVFAVIPVGAFVDPDNEQTKAATSSVKKRIYGIGIMNNLVIGIVSGLVVLGLFSMLTLSPGVHVYAVDSTGPAGVAGMRPNFVITDVNGVTTNTVEEIVAALNLSPSSNINGYYKDSGDVVSYSITPNDNVLGVVTVNTPYFMSLMKSRFAPLVLLVAPISSISSPNSPMTVLAFEDGNTNFFVEPFHGFWFLLHVAFWVFWVNIAIGLSNAIPALPFDGGLIVHEYIKPLCERIGVGKYSMYVTWILTIIMLGLLAGVILLPHLFHMGG